MLKKLPHVVGEALSGIRPGLEKTVYFGDASLADVPETLLLASPAFVDEQAIPSRFTADGAGLSPPLLWRGVPEEAQSLVLLIEDADSPTPSPLVHLIVHDLPGTDGELAEGALGEAESERPPLGRNSYLSARYLPPDPPPGHGPHRYVIQAYALDRPPELGATPGRGEIIGAMRDHTIARGCLIGTYMRP
ncbi:MAG: YbhB/YbcL family Raf kinase inhibitor-like protein [Rhodospirillales bacterium]|jgi:Raf kinase inhibitor-like YbhB/YbcL family protein|nr:YbhB/YbcL family Raf kinase inhibitor-like protein [Rhodospirillales bacterium]